MQSSGCDPEMSTIEHIHMECALTCGLSQYGQRIEVPKERIDYRRTHGLLLDFGDKQITRKNVFSVPQLLDRI
jgi:hypothetical protein